MSSSSLDKVIKKKTAKKSMHTGERQQQPDTIQNATGQTSGRITSSVNRTLNGYVVPPVYRPPARHVEPGQRAKKLPSNAPPARKGQVNPPRSAIRNEGGRFLQATPLRVRFAKITSRSGYPVKSSAVPASSRISTINIRPHLHAQKSTTIETNSVKRVRSKTTVELTPLWYQLDKEYEEQTLRLNNPRDRDGFAKRITHSKRTVGANNLQDVEMRDANLDVAQIAPALILVVNGVAEDSDSDAEDEDRRDVRVARKNIPPTVRPEEVGDTSSESEEEDESASTPSHSDSESSSASPTEESDMDMDEVEIVDGPEIVLLDAPQRYTPGPEAGPMKLEPPNRLIQAIEKLSPIVRMQKAGHLPFLLRNIRKGFHSRCSTLQLPIFTDGRESKLSVVYEHVAGEGYYAHVPAWRCPLCDLLGNVKTREMLDCHLRWDHADVFCEWQQGVQTDTVDSWELRILIPEIITKVPDNIPIVAVSTPPREEPLAEYITSRTTPFDRPLRSVYLSPARPRPSDVAPRPPPPLLLPKIKVKKPDPDTETPSISASVTPFDPSSRGGSTGGTSGTGPSGRASGTPVISNATYPHRATISRTITPPPLERPLGPAAQYPYLPAKSDYGGPTVKYSGRPNGPCLFDLLGTLPMEQYGLLDWDIIDREDEICENHELQEEYRVIQALWMRWIMLNRNKFIANYVKGTKSFVDDYWKIIHRAAGWDALRFWLITLLTNRCLKCHDVVQILRHYEDLTGMDSWYE